MRIPFLGTLLVCVAFYVGSANAFGFGNCCSGSPCGIIPCDNACAGSALTAMGSQISAALSQLGQASGSLTSTLNDVSTAQADLASDMLNAYINRKDDMIESLSGSDAKLDAVQQQSFRTEQALIDYKARTIVKALEEGMVSRLFSENNRMFNVGTAQPVTGETAANRTAAIKLINETIKKSTALVSSEFIAYINNKRNEGGKGANSLQKLNLLRDLSVTSFSQLQGRSTLDKEEVEQLIELATVMMGDIPLEPESGQINVEVELQRRIYNATMTIAYSSFVENIIERTGIDDGEWVTFHESAELNQEKKLSQRAAIESDVYGRLTTPGWWKEVRLSNETGLHRESVYLKAIEGHLLNQLAENSRSTSTLSSLYLNNVLATNQDALHKKFNDL